MEQWRPAAGRNPCPRGNKTRPPLPGRSNVAKTNKNWTSQHIVFIARRDLWNLRRVAADIHSFLNLESKPRAKRDWVVPSHPKVSKTSSLGLVVVFEKKLVSQKPAIRRRKTVPVEPRNKWQCARKMYTKRVGQRFDSLLELRQWQRQFQQMAQHVTVNQWPGPRRWSSSARGNTHWQNPVLQAAGGAVITSVPSAASPDSSRHHGRRRKKKRSAS